METDLEMEDLLHPTNNNYRPRGNKASSKSNHIRLTLIAVLVGLALPILIPALHMLAFSTLFDSDGYEVDKRTCTCGCWDTVFKGPYEAGLAKFKHVYFNSTSNAWKMWIITITFFIGLYETFKHLFLLWFKGRLRYSMAFLVACSIHSHYYAWWNHWNYWNDEFYDQWAHQIFFTLTELISTFLSLSQMDRRKPTQPLPLLIIGNIAAFHISCAMWDQFFANVFQFSGQMHQVVRDILLMMTDCIQVAVVWKELKLCAGRKGLTITQLVTDRSHLTVLGGITAIMFFYVLVCP